MLNVQQYLIENSVEKLTEEFGIKVREYPEEGIIILNYSMIDSPKSHPIVIECRSLILENASPYNVISRSFDRFFNYNECQNTNKFKFDNAVIWEKLDGSIINVYYHNDKWNISTKSMALGEATTPIGDKFSDIFKSVVDMSIFSKYDNIGKTFIFELVSPLNRVVKPYTTTEAYLLSVRCKYTGKEASLTELHEYSTELNIKLPTHYRLSDYTAIIATFKDLAAVDEGYVAIDYETHHRLKIKNPSYLAISNMRENGAISEKRLVQLVFSNDTDEYLLLFPEDRDIFNPYINAFDQLMNDINNSYNLYSNIESQKDFALAISELHYKSTLFQMRKGLNVDDIFTASSQEFKVNLLLHYTKL